MLLMASKTRKRLSIFLLDCLECPWFEAKNLQDSWSNLLDIDVLFTYLLGELWVVSKACDAHFIITVTSMLGNL